MIDTHTHLFSDEFVDDFDEVVQRALDAGVKKMLFPNIDHTTTDRMLDCARRYPNCCYPMIGFHPTSVEGDCQKELTEMKKLLIPGHPFVGIGEIGLDLYWDKTYLKEQLRVFEEQIQWALEADLPVVIHCRSAYTELLSVLVRYKSTSLRGVFHSYTGEIKPDALLEYENFLLGINGVVTFKKSNLSEMLETVPLNRLLLETDSPYLAPVPYRGKRNESSYIVKVAERIADIYKINTEEVNRVTTDAALRLFNTLS